MQHSHISPGLLKTPSYVLPGILFALWILYGAVADHLYLSIPPESIPFYLAESTIISAIMIFMRLPLWSVLMVLVSTFIQAVFLYDVDITENAPDITGHRHYVLHLLSHYFMPPVPMGFQPSQPPLFYMYSAVCYRIGEWIGMDPWHAVRMSSRALYFAYILLSLKLFDNLRLPLLAYMCAVAITIYWPTSHMLSVRFNSDIWFAGLFMATLILLQHWTETLSYKYLALALLLAGLNILGKATGFIALVTVAGVVAQQLFHRRITYRYFFNRKLAWGIAAITLALGYFFGRTLYYRIFGTEELLWFANIHDGQAQYGPLSLYLLFHFDPVYFVMHPGLSFDMVFYNQYTFWGYFFRTLLYSQGYSHSLDPSQRINELFLAVLAVALWQLRPRKYTFDNRYADILVIGLISILLLYILQRGLVPDINLAYGRRVQPIVAVLAGLAALTLKELHAAGHKKLYLLAAFACLAFAVASYGLAAGYVLRVPLRGVSLF